MAVCGAGGPEPGKRPRVSPAGHFSRGEDVAEAPVSFQVESSQRTQWIAITDRVSAAVRQAGVRDGCVQVFIPHTTAGVTINENADPSVAEDMRRFFDSLVPKRPEFTHAEGNSDAHIKASMLGCSLRVIVRDGRLCLGRWQGIYFCEFDGPRTREVWLSFD